MSKDTTQSFSSAFQQFLKKENLETQWNEKDLIHSWEKIMGKTIASRTTKISIDKGKMFVYLSSAPLKNELTNNKEKVLALLEEEMGKKIITEIRFL